MPVVEGVAPKVDDERTLLGFLGMVEIVTAVSINWKCYDFN
jgi:hypothetical protein